MRTRLALCLAVTIGSVAAAASGCGGDSDDDPFASAGKDGGGSGGKGGSTGGAGGSTGGTGGSTGGSGGSLGSAGSLGNGGSAGDSGPCAAPADASKSALCLRLVPETMRFETDPRQDGNGVLVVQVYDTPTPDPGDGGPAATPLSEQLVPQQGDAAPSEISVSQLPELRFDGLPARVYVRAFFVDNFDFFNTPDDITWGVWVGGYDFAGGLNESPPIGAQQLTIGAGTRHNLPLTALRRLNVDLSLSTGTVPLDNAQGPASAIAIRNQVPGGNELLFGVAADPCVNISGTATERLTGLIVGSGVFYFVAAVDDYNLMTGDLPPGGIIALEFPDGGFRLPDATRVTVAADAYTVTHAVPLNFVVPLEDAGAPPSFSCP